MPNRKFGPKKNYAQEKTLWKQSKTKRKKKKEKQFVSLGKRKVISEVNNNITVP